MIGRLVKEPTHARDVGCYETIAVLVQTVRREGRKISTARGSVHVDFPVDQFPRCPCVLRARAPEVFRRCAT